MEKVTEMPNITRAKVPNSVKATAPLPADLSQNKVVKAVKNSLAKSAISPKPLLMASIIAAPIIYSFLYIE